MTYAFTSGREPLALRAGDGFALPDGEAHRGRAGARGVRLFLIDRAGSRGRPVQDAGADAVNLWVPLSAAEVVEAVAILRQGRQLDDAFGFVAVDLLEPPKAQLAEHVLGEAVEREARAVLINRRSGAVHDTVVSLDTRAVRSWTAIPEAQPRSCSTDSTDSTDSSKRASAMAGSATLWPGAALPTWTCARRPLVGCCYGEDDEDRRLMRTLIYVRMGEGDNLYAHPVDNLVAVFDGTGWRSWRWRTTASSRCPRPRTTMPPMRNRGCGTSSPWRSCSPTASASSSTDGRCAWQNWYLRIGFTSRGRRAAPAGVPGRRRAAASPARSRPAGQPATCASRSVMEESASSSRRAGKSSGRNLPRCSASSICSRLRPVRSGMSLYTKMNAATLKPA